MVPNTRLDQFAAPRWPRAPIVTLTHSRARLPSTRLSLSLTGALSVAILAFGCGGGGGGGGVDFTSGGSGSQPANGANDFVLQTAFIARPIIDSNGVLTDLVNPASLYEVDPVTGLAAPGFPQPLVPGTDLNTLAPINFAQVLDPITPQVPLVARNAAVILEFSFAVDASSLLLDNSDPAALGKLTAASPLQVRLNDGSLVDARAAVDGRRIALFARDATQAGWEPSPLVFDTLGNAVEDPSGFMRIVMGDGVGTGPLLSLQGDTLVPRLPDRLGTLSVPFPFNPGNSQLDPLAQQTESGTISFNGFLPDLKAPRIIRPVVLSGTVDINGVDFIGLSIRGTALAIPANTVANGGDGEWADSLLVISGAGGEVTQYVVSSNTAFGLAPAKPVFHLKAGSAIDSSVIAGSAYTITRTEFYEPIPPPLPNNPVALANITVDPALHPRDPLDPQDLINHDLRYFVRMYDEFGVERTDVWNPAENLFGPVKGKFGPVPARTTPRVQFSEPMEPSSFRPFETFYVTDQSLPKSDPALEQQRLGRSVASTDLRTLSFEPFLEDQFDASGSKYVGFGGTPASLKLVLRSVPEPDELAALVAGASSQQKAQFFDLDTQGVLGLTDLGGRGLGLPPALLDQGNPNFFLLQPASPGRGAYPPAVDFSVAFQTLPSTDPDFGVIVHRFMGQASSSNFTYPTGSTHDQVTTGVEYHDWLPQDDDHDGTIDRRFIYGPILLDVGLNLPGRLTGAPANTIEHLIDDFNNPKPAPFSSNTGEDVLPTIGFGVKLPLNSPYGCRFQQLFRQGDASPAFSDYNGVVLDLVGMAWAPLGNTVTNETIENMTILVGLSAVNNTKGPNTNQSLGIPSNENSGMQEQFDCNLLDWQSEQYCGFTTMKVPAELQPYAPFEPKVTEVVRAGTTYSISKAQLFKPANALNKPLNQTNMYLNYPTFNTGVDPTFGKTDVRSFPYDSRFPMIVEAHIEPAANTFPSNSNTYRFSPGILSSVLPRFRVWSQGQHPLANCIPNYNSLGCPAVQSVPPCSYRAGEGGPLLKPGSFNLPIKPPFPKNNNMPTLFPSSYILPPREGFNNNKQPLPDATVGACAGPPSPAAPMGDPTQVVPTCNTNPDMNWYYANGMQAFPLPDLVNFPGPTGFPGSPFYGYGPGGPPFPMYLPGFPIGLDGSVNEPSYNCNPGKSGDNSRYYMMWKYRKRVSRIESPTIEAQPGQAGLVYHHPIIDPPLDSVNAAAGLRVEFRSSTQLDFSLPALSSTYLLPTDPTFSDELSGSNFDRVFVKFRATFAVASGLLQPPSLDTVVIPYERLNP